VSVVLVDCLLTASNRERPLALRINVRGMLIGMVGDVCSSPEANKLASYNEKKRGDGGVGVSAQMVSEGNASQKRIRDLKVPCKGHRVATRVW